MSAGNVATMPPADGNMAPGMEGGWSDYAQKRGIRYFLINFVDLLGVVRSKLVPSAAIEEIARNGAGFAGYAAYFDLSPADPDLFAIPDPTSVIQLPWKKDIAWVASDLYMHGKLLKQAPRQQLKDQVLRAKMKGFRPKTGVECEFFLLSSEDCIIADKHDTASKPCYEQGVLMRRYEIISEIVDCLQSLGWKPYQADHEDGNGQFEINWEYDDCIATADKHVFFKFMAKSIAEKHGFRATFMPKPFTSQTGNGAHCHVSLWELSGKANLFYDKDGDLGLSRMAYEFMGGVLVHAKALTAILNPTVNSYKRIDGTSTLSGSSWAPCSVSYTGNNRTHMLRIPDAGRFELRLPDGAVNPYLLQSSILACGLVGIDSHLDPGPRCDWNGHFPPPQGKTLETLPKSLLEALQELSTSDVLAKAMGDEFIKSYLKVQMERWRSFTRHLSQWEIDTTLDC